MDYAASVGATVAGATDTQGEAPKFWIVEDMQGQWHPDGGNLPFPIRRYALLKFPMPEAGPRAGMILRHEARYQRIAARCGLRVTAELPTELPAAADGALLLPRFDRRWEGGNEVRLGVIANLDTRFEEAELASPRTLFERAIRQTMPQLQQLPAVMRDCGIDEGIIELRAREIERLVTGLQETGVVP
ncbi:MAG: hypothetical protein AB7G76_00035 [Steroidobacteraceae bacterium]